MKRYGGRNLKCVFLRERSQCEATYILCDFNCMLFRKRQNCRDSNNKSGFQGLEVGVGEDERDFFRAMVYT